MVQVKDQQIRFDIWNAMFISLTVFKRDKLEEVETSMMALYYEFALQLQDADFNDLLKITNSMMTSDKLMSYVNGCKVNILFLPRFESNIKLTFFLLCSLLFRASSQ